MLSHTAFCFASMARASEQVARFAKSPRTARESFQNDFFSAKCAVKEHVAELRVLHTNYQTEQMGVAQQCLDIAERILDTSVDNVRDCSSMCSELRDVATQAQTPAARIFWDGLLRKVHHLEMLCSESGDDFIKEADRNSTLALEKLASAHSRLLR